MTSLHLSEVKRLDVKVTWAISVKNTARITLKQNHSICHHQTWHVDSWHVLFINFTWRQKVIRQGQREFALFWMPVLKFSLPTVIIKTALRRNVELNNCRPPVPSTAKTKNNKHAGGPYYDSGLTLKWSSRPRAKNDSYAYLDFYPHDAMLARVFATATCPSVRPSVTRRYCA